MTSVSQIIKSRQRRKNSLGKTLSAWLGKVSFAVLIVLGLILSILIIGVSFFYSSVLNNLPSHESLPSIFNSAGEQLYRPTKIFDRSGQHLIAVLENPNGRGQKYLPYGDGYQNSLPETLVLATIASLEPNFWSNPGLSWDSLQYENRPTISQKITKQFLFDDESQSRNRTFQEWLLAAQIVDEYGHELILEWYLNSEYYGNLAYGADAAARIYFGKSASDINLAEAATLVAAAKSPNVNPIDSPVASSESKDQILNDMLSQGLINNEQLNSALEQKIKVRAGRGYPVNIEPTFTNLVIEQVSQFIPQQQIFRGGLEIITSLDYELQNQVNCSVEYQLNRINGESSSQLTGAEFNDCEMARLLPTNYEDYDGQETPIVADVLVMDPIEGQLLAFTAGRTRNQGQEGLSGHPPGSILSPFIYLTSFTRGSSPSTLLWDIPANIPSAVPDLQNDIEQFNGPVNIRTALANDYLVPVLQVMTQMDPDQVWQMLGRMGLTNLQVPSGNGAYRLLFQGGEIVITELSQAYGVLANQGVLAGIPESNNDLDDSNSPLHPQVVLKVLDESSDVLLDCTDQLTQCRPTKRPVLTQELAYLVTDVLSDETARWSSLGHPNSLEIGRPAAAKIGTTSSNEGIWTLGYTPDLLTGVWVGPETGTFNQSISPEWAAGLWHAVIQYTSKDYPVNEFTIPGNINEVQVCNPSGMLPSKDCPQVNNEIFIKGYEPTQIDNLYKTFPINSESGRLATIYTSPALIKEEVFLLFPPEAEEWANEAGIHKIPENYDVLDIEINQDIDANINSPTMFSTIKGTVQIFGRAAGEGFVSYRLQVGAGLNPDAWYLIGDEVDEAVNNGKLGTWDTSELSGLHVLQLLVAYDDDSVASSLVQVTIDNQVPEINFRFPEDGQIIDSHEIDSITILANASDNLGIDKVEISIDGDILASINSLPYAVPWRITTGKHIIRGTAYDHAGNKTDTRVQIIVE